MSGEDGPGSVRVAPQHAPPIPAAPSHGSSGSGSSSSRTNKRRRVEATTSATSGSHDGRVSGLGAAAAATVSMGSTASATSTGTSAIDQLSPLPPLHPALLSAIPGMVFTYVVASSGSSYFAYVSPYSDQLFHLSPERVVSSSGGSADVLLETILDEDRPEFRDSLVTSLREGSVWDWTGRVTVEEAVKTVRFTSAMPPVRQIETATDEEGGSSAESETYSTVFHGIVLDITDQQQPQQQQQQQSQPSGPSSTDLVPAAPSTICSSSSSSSKVHVPSSISSLRTVFDSAPHPIIALDANGVVTEWNRTAEVLTGYPLHEAVGKNFVLEFVVGACRKDVLQMLDDLSHRRDKDRFSNSSSNGKQNSPTTASAAAAADRSAKASNSAKADPSCEATLQTRPGHPPVHLLLTASPRLARAAGIGGGDGVDGKGGGAVIIAQDMSKQHAALALHRSETEKGIMEWLSHEVRNPLSVAVEASRTLKEDPSDDPEENSNNLELICLSLGYIVELLTDMLDLNKCAEGKITISPTVCRLREDIVLPTKRMLDQRRKSVELIIDGGEEIWALVDRLRLQQVLTNLIVNSMKYTSIGFIRVGIRRITREEIGKDHLECATGTESAYDQRDGSGLALPTMDSLFGSEAATSGGGGGGKKPPAGKYNEDGGVLISVSDSGTGIDPSNYSNLFERWEKLGSKTNGTGIGLCLCRSLMDVMGGRIFLSKTYNSGIPGNPGCQFCIVLPPTALKLSSRINNGSGVLASNAGDHSEALSEGPEICTAALSKRLSRDKNKPALPPRDDDKLMMPAPRPRSSSASDLIGKLWDNGALDDRPECTRKNGFGLQSKKVSFAPHLDYSYNGSQQPQRLDELSNNNGLANSGSHQTAPTLNTATNNDAGAVTPTSDAATSASATASSQHTHQHHHQHQQIADDPFHNTCLTGKFRILVVDDDETFRIMFVRRLKRMFPDSAIDESPSGEDSIEKAKSNIYDLMTMDHFMALDELNGADTIRALRGNNCDACIVGISGNTKTVHHLEAGADDFVRKPVPTDRRFIRRLVTKMSPPAVWKVLIADDCKLNLKFMHRKLTKVSSPHYTTKKDSEKRWQFTLKTNGEDCVDVLKNEWFDLCVLDQHMGPGLKGTDVASFIREGAVNPNAIVVINTGVEKNLQTQGNWDDNTVPFNFQWTKPAPSVDKIRQDLCLELVAEKTISGANFGESLRKVALLKASVIENEADLEAEAEAAQDGTSNVVSEGSINDFDSSKSDKETKKLPEHRKVLQKLYDEIGDELAFCDMCNLFVTTVPPQLDSIDSNLNTHNWTNLSLILHKLKGTLQVFHIVGCVDLIKPLYEHSLLLKTRGQKRKHDEDGNDVANSELAQMRGFVDKLRHDIVAVIDVCQGVVDNGMNEDDKQAISEVS